MHASYDNAQFGAIPACLFHMPSLRTLHLSGNGHSGSLPSDAFPQLSLTDISLSHNALTGTIPLFIQHRLWNSLDLSFNKLTGALDTDFVPGQNGTTLYLTANKLSGALPPSLKHAQNISVLTGNLFLCNYERTDVPQHDPGAREYSCGSNQSDVSLFVWCGLLTAVVLLLRCVKRKKMLVSPDILQEKTQRHMHWSSAFRFLFRVLPVVSSFGGDLNREKTVLVAEVEKVLSGVRKLFLSLTAFMLVVLLPIYTALGHYFKTYTHSYAWFVSAGFLSGLPSTVVLIVAWTALMAFFAWRCAVLTRDAGGDDSSRNWLLSVNVAVQEVAAIKMTISNVKHSLIVATVFFVNAVFVVGANLLFVAATIYSSTTVKTIAQVGLALFKLLWTVLVLPSMLDFVRRVRRTPLTNILYAGDSAHQLLEMSTVDDKGQNSPQPCVIAAATQYELTNVDEQQEIFHIDNLVENNIPVEKVTPKSDSVKGTQLEAILNIFNNIVIPCIATAVLSVDCFYHVIVAAPTVQSTYVYNTCQSSTVNLGCISYNQISFSVKYQPSYNYSYQCSSTLLTSYISVYATMYILDTFVYPIFRNLYVRYGVVRFAQARASLKHKMRSFAVRQRAYRSQKQQQNDPASSTIEHTANSSDEEVRMLMLKLNFRRVRFSVRLVTNMAIFLTFGVLFPPLGVIIAVAICAQTFELQRRLNDLYDECKSKDMPMDHTTDLEAISEKNRHKAERKQVMDELNKQLTAAFDGTLRIIRSLLWMLYPLVGSFYAFFVFDALGNEAGYRGALWAPIVMTAVAVGIGMLFGGSGGM